MNAFAVGFASVPVAAFTAWLIALDARTPGPSQPGLLAAVLAVNAGIIFIILWLGIRGALLALKDRDIRAEFRAADPRGCRSLLAGVLSGAGGVAALIGSVTLGGPGENERDMAMFRFFALGFGGLVASPFVGVAVFLGLFRPRPAPPAPPG